MLSYDNAGSGLLGKPGNESEIEIAKNLCETRTFIEQRRCPESTLKCELRQTLARSGIPSEFML